MTDELCDSLLEAWLSLSAAVRNERIVQTMTFREVFVCNILYRAQSSKQDIASSDIVRRTGMLKSQVNKVLDALEDRGLIKRERSEEDHRFILIRLTSKGSSAYEKEHAHVLIILQRLTGRLGEKETETLVHELNNVSAIMADISSD